MKMDSEISVTIVRHGQSEGNVQGILQGHLDLALTDLGRKQAKLAGVALKDEAFDYVCASDLERAYNTACGIVEESSTFSGQIHTDILLREQCYGILEGRIRKEIQELRSQANENKTDLEGYESKDQLRARAAKYMKSLFKTAQEGKFKNCLVVTHGAWIWQLAHWLCETNAISGLTEEMLETSGWPSNVCISQFSLNIDPDTLKITSGNCLKFYDNRHVHL